jgi:uncharacterized membrane protein YbaN (DUF454 family)
MVALGIVGAFLPLMPTTIFLILSAWFFARSSPRLENWILNHPRFGNTVRNWQTYGAVPVRAKIMACGGMTIGFLVFWVSVHPSILVAICVAVFLVGSAIYVVSRPTLVNE